MRSVLGVRLSGNYVIQTDVTEKALAVVGWTEVA
jgi:hypothetical protein